ncbi:hypothetical protein FRC01_008610, partial [Tulasnella sp. 417]
MLCDFGVSSFIHESESEVASGLTTSKSIKGSTRYMSPELCLEDEDSKHTLQSDVWAWGCTVFEVMTECIPYSEKSKDIAIILAMQDKSAPGSINVFDDLLGANVNPACHLGVSSLQLIIPQCWDFDPTQRPSSAIIVRDIAIPSKNVEWVPFLQLGNGPNSRSYASDSADANYPLPPQRIPPSHFPSLGAQQQLGPYPFPLQYQPPQSTDLYGMSQQEPQQPNTYGKMTGNTPPQQLQPTPPMNPQRPLQNIGPHHSPFNPMFSTPPNTGNHSRSSSHGSPSNYSPFSLPYTPPHAPFYSPQNGSPPFPRSPPSANGSFVHGQQVQHAPQFGPGSGSHSGLIDLCHLFIKNLDPNIDSYELFTSFRRFGHIVSARVMRTETGQSRGFGFVSYQTPDQAASATNAMNGTTLRTKPIIVRLHEPKQLRQEKLATQYSAGRNPHPRSASGAISPSPSDPGEVGSPMEGVRRSSGSYYQAALNGTLGLGYQQWELSALSPVVRRDVLTGELTRQLKSFEIVPSNDLSGIVESLVAMSLTDVVEVIHNRKILEEQVEKITSSQLATAPTVPAPEVPGTPAIEPAANVHILATLARLPAIEIIKLANSPNATGLPLAKADPEVVKATDEFIDGLERQSEEQKKQVVGTKLFKAIKAFGTRNAKITIHLLETEDLRALTHLMNSYPSVLKEKVQQAAATTAA